MRILADEIVNDPSSDEELYWCVMGQWTASASDELWSDAVVSVGDCVDLRDAEETSDDIKDSSK